MSEVYYLYYLSTEQSLGETLSPDAFRQPLAEVLAALVQLQLYSTQLQAQPSLWSECRDAVLGRQLYHQQNAMQRNADIYLQVLQPKLQRLLQRVGLFAQQFQAQQHTLADCSATLLSQPKNRSRFLSCLYELEQVAQANHAEVQTFTQYLAGYVYAVNDQQAGLAQFAAQYRRQWPVSLPLATQTVAQLTLRQQAIRQDLAAMARSSLTVGGAVIALVINQLVSLPGEQGPVQLLGAAATVGLGSMGELNASAMQLAANSSQLAQHYQILWPLHPDQVLLHALENQLHNLQHAVTQLHEHARQLDQAWLALRQCFRDFRGQAEGLNSIYDVLKVDSSLRAATQDWLHLDHTLQAMQQQAQSLKPVLPARQRPAALVA
ncbi:HBL/NHE enterotoxin family protein [Chitinibacter sp. ZOR0017]|uniref:HBL/NHE enterotoxin family protein n=1 Tax=Chitinibacter sp. ZOR0017 TaxID=1339254 RepID=UPI000647DEEE|nr:HBL/NHE enterotoxin family protein [Chitinibacter sp. ZOR0017]